MRTVSGVEVSAKVLWPKLQEEIGRRTGEEAEMSPNTVMRCELARALACLGVGGIELAEVIKQCANGILLLDFGDGSLTEFRLGGALLAVKARGGHA